MALKVLTSILTGDNNALPRWATFIFIILRAIKVAYSSQPAFSSVLSVSCHLHGGKLTQRK
jgi:hypothetical protein